MLLWLASSGVLSEFIVSRFDDAPLAVMLISSSAEGTGVMTGVTAVGSNVFADDDVVVADAADGLSSATREMLKISSTATP